MAFLIGGANSAADTGYDVDNSCRWNRADTPYMHQTFSGAGNRDKWTFSCWVKKCSNGVEQRLITTSDNSTFDDNVRFESTDQILIYIGGDRLKTNALYRDLTSWYHICAIWDSGNSTEGDRVQLWVNGTRVTSFATESYPDQNTDGAINNNTPHYFGVTNATANSHFLHGYLAEVVFQNDNADSPVDKFGEFDSDSPTIFKPIDVSGLTLGTNGTYLDFEDSSNLGNDIGGGTDWAEVNFAAADQATDTPTNSFATLNPLYLAAASYTIEEGNLQITANASNAWRSLYTTMPVTNGKWYFEVKVDAINAGDADNIVIGIVDIEQVVQTSSNGKFFGTSRGYGYHAKNGQKLTNDTVTDNGVDYGDAYTAGDIVGCAFDLDNQKIYWSKNGTFQDSGDPTTGATGTGSAFDIGSGYTYTPVIANYYTGEHYSFNFGGCPAFSISSGNADGNGYGNFEYAVPSGYFALCTKNLAEYG